MDSSHELTAAGRAAAGGTLRSETAGSDDVAWMSYAIALLRYPRTIILTSAVLSLAVLITQALTTRTYTAQSRFLPEGEGQRGGGGLAAPLGLALSVQGGEGAELYRTILTSRELQLALARTEYRFLANPKTGDSLHGTIMELYGVPGETEDLRLIYALHKLEGIVSVSVDRITDVVSMTTKTPWAELSILLNRRMLELVNEFNVERRQSRAATERRFVEERLAQAQEELRAAEREMEAFLARNRGYETSPQLRFEAGRVQRQLDVKQQVFLTLTNAYENARIEEVRNTPVITILDPPSLPQPSGGRARKVLMGGVLSVGFAVGVALVLEFLRRTRAQRPDLVEELTRSLRLAARKVVPRLGRPR